MIKPCQVRLVRVEQELSLADCIKLNHIPYKFGERGLPQNARELMKRLNWEKESIGVKECKEMADRNREFEVLWYFLLMHKAQELNKSKTVTVRAAEMLNNVLQTGKEFQPFPDWAKETLRIGLQGLEDTSLPNIRQKAADDELFGEAWELLVSRQKADNQKEREKTASKIARRY